MELGSQVKKAVFLLPIFAGILFGSVGIFVRTFSANELNNPTILFLRTAFALLEMFVFILIYDRKLLRINIRHLPIFLGTGLLGMLSLNLCYNEAINSLTLSLAAILLSTAPIFVMILAAILFKEKITRKKLFCMLVQSWAAFSQADC